MEGQKIIFAVCGAMITVVLGVGGLLGASIERLDGRVDRMAEYVVTTDNSQTQQIQKNTKALALMRQELQIWLKVYRNDPARDEANQ